MMNKRSLVIIQSKLLIASLKQLNTAIRYKEKFDNRDGETLVKDRVKDVKMYYGLLMQEIGEKDD